MNLLNEDRLSLKEAAQIVGASEQALTRWYKKGFNGVKLEAVRVGKRIVTSRQAVERFVTAINS